MKVRKQDIQSVGLTLIYEPDGPIDPLVDIVLVHGFGGHPVHTWTCRSHDKTAPTLAIHTTIIPRAPNSSSKGRLIKPPPTGLRRSNSEPLIRKHQRCATCSKPNLCKNTTKSSSRLEVSTTTTTALGTNHTNLLPQQQQQHQNHHHQPTRSRSVLRRKNSTKSLKAPAPAPAPAPPPQPPPPRPSRLDIPDDLLPPRTAGTWPLPKSSRPPIPPPPLPPPPLAAVEAKAEAGIKQEQEHDQEQEQEPSYYHYWPLDFLPLSCPAARIWTWGYQVIVDDKGPRRPQGDVFAHARELLAELAGARKRLGRGRREVVFVVHSTGGVVVKEMLRQGSLARDAPRHRVLLETAGVVFLASPHRGTEHCSLGDAIKSMAAVTMAGKLDPEDPAFLDLCRAARVDAEPGRAAFVKLWDAYNFGVKTFQESVVPSCHRPELRAEAMMRRLSSFFGDPREVPETVCASHDDVCRFASPEDQGYRALVKVLESYIANEEARRRVLTSQELEFLTALRPPLPSLPLTNPSTSYPGACLWLYDLADFQAWHHRIGAAKHKVLWIQGEPGSGKSTLLRSLRKRLERQWSPAGAIFISVAAAGPSIYVPQQPHGTDPAGVYRSLLAQLFRHDPALRKQLLDVYAKSRSGEPTSVIDDSQIISFFADEYIPRHHPGREPQKQQQQQQQLPHTTARRTFIFVQISDDSHPTYVRDLLTRLTRLARHSTFSVCVVSAHYHHHHHHHPDLLPPLNEEEESGVITIPPLHLRNADPVLCYIDRHLVTPAWHNRDRSTLVRRTARKAGGVWLWAEIVVNILNAAIAEGATREMIERTLDEVPGDLHGLYEWMLSTLNERERKEALGIFQWVMLGAEPMRLRDLVMAVRVMEEDVFAVYGRMGRRMGLEVGPPVEERGVRRLRNSEVSEDRPEEWYRWVRARSIGLLEVRPEGITGMCTPSGPSGTQQQQQQQEEPLGWQRVWPIHASVRTFFLSGRGFACLAAGNPSIPRGISLTEFVDVTHYALLRACLTYLNMRDWEGIEHGTGRSKRKGKAPPVSLLTNSKLPPGAARARARTQPSTATGPHESPNSPTRGTTSPKSQRDHLLASRPFLRYAATRMVYHLLSPEPFRYFLPQGALFLALAAGRCRLWKRWTWLLGIEDGDDVEGILAQCCGGGGGDRHRNLTPLGVDPENLDMSMAAAIDAAADAATARLFSPVFGARYRLERVLRKVAQLAAAGERDVGTKGLGALDEEKQQVGVAPTDGIMSPTTVVPLGDGEFKMVLDRARGGGQHGRITPQLNGHRELTLPVPDAGGGSLRMRRGEGSLGVVA